MDYCNSFCGRILKSTNKYKYRLASARVKWRIGVGGEGLGFLLTLIAFYDRFLCM